MDRPWTLFTSTFSHESSIHFVANLATLMETGPVLENYLGTRLVVKLFVLSGMRVTDRVGSFSLWFLSPAALPNPRHNGPCTVNRRDIC